MQQFSISSVFTAKLTPSWLLHGSMSTEKYGSTKSTEDDEEAT